MMTRNIRKAISVVCVIAMLLSLCVVAFMGSTSAAISQNDALIDAWQTVLDLDFDDEKGIVGVNNSSTSYTFSQIDPDHGKSVQMSILKSSGSLIQLGKDDQQVSGGTPFAVEAGKTYRITAQYKILKNSTTAVDDGTDPYNRYKGNIGLILMKANGGVQPDAAGRGWLQNSNDKQFTFSSANATEESGSWKLNQDSGWIDYEYRYEVPSGIGAQTSVLLGVYSNSSTPRTGTVIIDNVKVEVLTGSVLADIDNEYVFDFKTGTTPIDTEAIAKAENSGTPHTVFAGVKNSSFGDNFTKADNNGLNFHFMSKGSFTKDNSGFGKDDGTGFSYNHNALVYDTDVAEGGSLTFKKNTTYIITAKYKVTDMGGNADVGLGIAVTKKKTDTANYEFASVKETAVSTEWKTLTAIVDTTGWDYINGKYLVLSGRTADADKNACILVESVTVKERRDVDADIAIIEKVVDGVSSYSFATAGVETALGTPDNNNSDRGFKCWSQSGSDIADPNKFVPVKGINTVEAKWSNTYVNVTFIENGSSRSEKLAVGATLARSDKRPDKSFFFEYWYDADGKKYDKVPENNITLYAKFSGAYIKFDQQGWNDVTTVGTNDSAIIVSEPGNSSNNVAKLTSDEGKEGANQRRNFMLTSEDRVGAPAFQLELNTRYFWSVKVKAADVDAEWDITWFCGNASAWTSDGSTHRTSLKSSAGGTGSSNEWVTVSGTFTTGSSFYFDRTNWVVEDKAFMTFYGSSEGNSTLYIDDLIVGKIFDENPVGTSAIKFNTNGPEILNLYGYPGEVIELPEDPTAGGVKFAGWYTDKKLSNKFTGKIFGTNDVTLYAKWQTIPFVVDFTDYAQGNKSARAEFVKDDKGNDYLDWWTGHAPDNSNYADSTTFFSVFLNKGDIDFTVNEGSDYVIKFKYKLLEGNIVAKPSTNGRLDGWKDRKEQDSVIVLDKVDANKWQEATIKFTATPAQVLNANYLSLAFAGRGHILIDDIVVEGGNSTTMNLYGSKMLYFITQGGKGATTMSGETGEAIGKLPSPFRDGYEFDKWYSDDELTKPFTATTYGEEDLVAYAGYHLAKFNEDFEEFPSSIIGTGFSSAHKLYNEKSKDFDPTNIQEGKVSVYRKGSTKGTQSFTVCRSDSLTLTVGKQYTISFYVKPANVTDAAATIGVINMKNHTAAINAPTSTNVVTTVGQLKANEWQQVSYTFTAEDEYVGITSTGGNDLYFDNITITLKGYTGRPTGDSSVNPLIIMMLVIIAAGALTLTGKKVFDK